MKETVARFPTMKDRVMGILGDLVGKQIWNMDHNNPRKTLWNGFKMCLFDLQSDCNPIYLRLPLPQLEEILKQRADVLKSFSTFVKELSSSRKNSNRVSRSIINLLKKMD